MSFNNPNIDYCSYCVYCNISLIITVHGIGRSQVRKLVGKVVSRDAVYYRRLTDRPEGTMLSEHQSTEQLICTSILLFRDCLSYTMLLALVIYVNSLLFQLIDLHYLILVKRKILIMEVLDRTPNLKQGVSYTHFCDVVFTELLI